MGFKLNLSVNYVFLPNSRQPSLPASIDLVPDDNVVRLNQLFELVATSIHFQKDRISVRKLVGQSVHFCLDVRRCNNSKHFRLKQEFLFIYLHILRMSLPIIIINSS